MNQYVFPHSSAIETLQLELSLLQVLHHRNKNQHHLQPFFKHLSILKRTLALLLGNVDSEFLLQKLRASVIPNAWESFSRIIARGEFVTLGLVLCASVPRISCYLGGIGVAMDMNLEEREVEVAMELGDDELGEIVRRDLLADETMDIEEENGEITSSRPTPPLLVATDHDSEKGTQVQEIQPTSVTADVPGIGDIQPPPKRRR